MALKHLKKQRGRFVGIPYTVANSKLFKDLRAPEVKLLFDLMTQYSGNNNGRLSPCHTLMRERGWASSSLHRAFNSLQHLGFVVVTRKGWKVRGKPTLVAVTWAGIDEPCNGVVYEEGIRPSETPLNYWCMAKASWKHKPEVKEFRKFQSPTLGKQKPSYSPYLAWVDGRKAS